MAKILPKKKEEEKIKEHDKLNQLKAKQVEFSKKIQRVGYTRRKPTRTSEQPLKQNNHFYNQ